MPAAAAKRIGAGTQSSRRVHRGEVEEKRSFPRSSLNGESPMAGGIVKATACSCEHKSEVASGKRILRGDGYGVIEKVPRPPGTPLPEFSQRAVDTSPDGEIAPDRPGWMHYQPQLTVVTRAGVRGGEDVIGALRAAVGVNACRAGAKPIRPATECHFDLSL